MGNELSNACDNYRAYLEKIVIPAAGFFLQKVSDNTVLLHDAFGTNLFLAHAIDYIKAIRSAAGKVESRTMLVQEFDRRFEVAGARFRSRKFELIDAVNNALKHIQLDSNRYGKLIESYGPIAFNCLAVDHGRVICILEGYRFDYSRVVLRPAIEALSSWGCVESEDLLELVLGDLGAEGQSLCIRNEEDPIDQMIDYCNPVCDDCAEPESDCQCATFVYDGKSGSFQSVGDRNFDFDDVMSRISSAYRKGD